MYSPKDFGMINVVQDELFYTRLSVFLLTHFPDTENVQTYYIIHFIRTFNIIFMNIILNWKWPCFFRSITPNICNFLINVSSQL